jgi:hypothetical protein
VLILAVTAIATAWSGYQAARGDGRQSVLYGESSRDRFEADAAATLGEQRLAADASMFNAWLQARAAGDRELQAMFVRRFKLRGVRMAAMGLVGLLVYGLVTAATLPRL